jgi:predicted DCC family thiol-disulfide oxidoreductase YuxK
VPRVERAVLLYDDDCGFCRVCVALVLAWDRRHRLRPAALQSEDAARLLAGMPESERMASWHLVQPDGRVQSAGAAFAPLFRDLPGGSWFAALANRFPHAAERAYALVAGNRTVLGRALPENARRWADAAIERHQGDRNSAPAERLSAQ